MTKVTEEVLGLVYRYAEWMVTLLRERKNQEKTSWRDKEVPLTYLIERLELKVKQLKASVKQEPRMRLTVEAWHKAADIGNYAWMIADKSEQEVHANPRSLP